MPGGGEDSSIDSVAATNSAIKLQRDGETGRVTRFHLAQVLSPVPLELIQSPFERRLYGLPREKPLFKAEFFELLSECGLDVGIY